MTKLAKFVESKEMESLKKEIKKRDNEIFELKTKIAVLTSINKGLVAERENLSKYNEIFLEKLSNGFKF